MLMNTLRKIHLRKFKKPYWAWHQKRWFGKWHLYLGIMAGLVLAVVGLTGSILVFQDEIDRALNPELFEQAHNRKKIDIASIIPVIQQKYPRIKISYIMDTSKGEPLSAYRVTATGDDKEYFINPYTAELSGKRIASSAFIRIVTSIHRTLLIPQWGRYIVGLAALSLLILTISGIRLWLPKKIKHLRKSLSVDFSTGFKRQNYDWHNVIGFFSAPVVVSLSITGLIITFNTIFIALLFLLSGRSPKSTASIFGARSTIITNQKPLTPAKITESVQRLIPGTYIMGIALPEDKNAAYRFDLYKEGTPKTGRRILVIADQYSGKLLVNSETDFPNTGQSYLSWLTPLHYGTFGGWPTRILALLGSLVPPALFVTGIIIWWPRYKKQRKNKNWNKIPNPRKDQTKLVNRTFAFYFTNGLKYAVVILLGALLSGALYGLISARVLAPALFMAYYIAIMVVINFTVATVALLIHIMGRIFKTKSTILIKYFAYSLAFLMVFLPLIILLNVFKLQVF